LDADARLAHERSENEDRLQRMEHKPSKFVTRQIRATPYPHEDTGWTIVNSAPSVCLFSSDFPHVEGGRNPIGRFASSMDAAHVDTDARQRFYVDNFVDLMGPVLERRVLTAESGLSPRRHGTGRPAGASPRPARPHPASAGVGKHAGPSAHAPARHPCGLVTRRAKSNHGQRSRRHDTPLNQSSK
jgi:hypothetical protein